MYERIHERDAKVGAQKGKVFDTAANRLIADHPKCTVINLACGFDTGFWRIENEKCKYIEFDLAQPYTNLNESQVITLKKEILKDHLSYELIGCSVLDTTWIDQVTSSGNTGFLLLAEGLFMWLLKLDATRVLQET